MKGFKKYFLVGVFILFLIILTRGIALFIFLLLYPFYLRWRKEKELKSWCEYYYKGGDFIALDLETTGLDSKKNEIIEIAAIRFNQKGERESFIKLIKPRSYVPFEIQEMTGIPISKVMEEGQSLEEVQEDFMNFIGNTPILGWNLDFDLNFLKRRGIKLSNPMIDVMKLAYDLLPKRVYKKGKRRRQTRRRFYLTSIAKDFGIYTRTSHRAGSDAYLTAKIFEKLMEQLKYKYSLKV